MMNREVAVIIPVYNEGSLIKKVLDELLKEFSNVICVNDGSTDNSAAEISKTKAKLVQHPLNLGQGAALQTGLEFARAMPKINYFVTFDADGQHRVKDIHHLLNKLRTNRFDIVLGSRFLDGGTNLKRRKRIALKAAVRFSNYMSGLNLTDTHNGLRAFNKNVADTLEITVPDMGHASEILEIISRNNYRFTEIPVVIEYTDYSTKKGQSIINGINIAFDLLIKKIVR